MKTLPLLRQPLYGLLVRSETREPSTSGLAVAGCSQAGEWQSRWRERRWEIPIQVSHLQVIADGLKRAS